ncbi:MAG: S9 family peptidase [Luteimonas sp.]|nr:S9 family peptidase [Luteimonas sp.]
MRYIKEVLALSTALAIAVSTQAHAVDVEPFVKRGSFDDIKISPTGEYYAASVPLEDRTALAILRRADNTMTGTVNLGRNTHIADFSWVSGNRVLISEARKFGRLDQPQLTGNLYATSAEGGRTDILVGQDVNVQQLGSNIKSKKVERVAAFLVDDLPEDDGSVLISVMSFGSDPFTRIEKLDVASGRRFPVGHAPIRNARFESDNSGVVRVAFGAGVDIVNKLYLRDGGNTEWRLINDESVSGRVEVPLGFSEDNRTLFLQVEQAQGPDAIVAFDTASGERKELLRDNDVDPERIIYRPHTRVPVGVRFMDGKPRTTFFDPDSAVARQYRSLEAAFPDESVFVTSATTDGRLLLVETGSDRNPGDFFLFDTVAKKAEHVVSRREWFDPEQMARMRPVSLQARDGLALHGYLTVPKGSDARNLPMVVMPHGGPFGIYDSWRFDDDVQLLAAAGYAVLQVNFRGSGNYGRKFRHDGARQWGGSMQDDVTDATRWAIEQGIADSARICIYGASYGGYAALMGVAREPALYRCAVGYIGVYDLPMMHTTGDVQRRGSGETYLREWIGTREALDTVSPTRMADRIKVPVFLAAGGEDERAPIEHSRRMEKALMASGVPVETLYYPTEGHGFYVEANRKEYYVRLLDFLSRNIGGKAASKD